MQRAYATPPAPSVAMLLVGSINLFLAATWMLASLLGAPSGGDVLTLLFLATMALVQLLMWAGSLLLARWLTLWGMVHGLGAGLAVMVAVLLTEAAWAALAFAVMVALAIADMAL